MALVVVTAIPPAVAMAPAAKTSKGVAAPAVKIVRRPAPNNNPPVTKVPPPLLQKVRSSGGTPLPDPLGPLAGGLDESEGEPLGEGGGGGGGATSGGEGGGLTRAGGGSGAAGGVAVSRRVALRP